MLWYLIQMRNAFHILKRDEDSMELFAGWDGIAVARTNWILLSGFIIGDGEYWWQFWSREMPIDWRSTRIVLKNGGTTLIQGDPDILEGWCSLIRFVLIGWSLFLKGTSHFSRHILQIVKMTLVSSVILGSYRPLLEWQNRRYKYLLRFGPMK